MQREVELKKALALKAASERSLSRSAPLQLHVAGLTIDLYLADSALRHSGDFVASYYQMFLGQRAKADVEIFYSEAPGNLSDPKHRLWNQRDPYAFEENIEGARVLVERDFSLLQSYSQSHQYFVVGPRLQASSSDSLDNLLNAIVIPSLTERQRLLLHATAVEKDEQAYVFFGPSGVGKSTLARMCWNQLGMRIIGSDQVLLNWGGEQLTCTATPTFNPDIPRLPKAWCHEALPVKALFHLQQRDELHFRRLTEVELWPSLLPELISLEDDSRRLQTIMSELSLHLSSSEITLGEFSYPLGEDFWPWLQGMAEWRVIDGQAEQSSTKWI